MSEKQFRFGTFSHKVSNAPVSNNKRGVWLRIFTPPPLVAGLSGAIFVLTRRGVVNYSNQVLRKQLNL